jgi:hypothetical protein
VLISASIDAISALVKSEYGITPSSSHCLAKTAKSSRLTKQSPLISAGGQSARQDRPKQPAKITAARIVI